jgi:hypothetical protein
MNPLFSALKRTGSDVRTNLPALVFPAISDFLFIFFFGWAYGLIILNKIDEFLAEIQVRLIQATGSMEEVQPTFLSDAFTADPGLPQLFGDFIVFIVYSVLLILILFIVFQSVSWFFAHKIAGSNVSLSSYVLSFSLISSIGMIVLISLLGIAFLTAANAMMENPGEIPPTPWLPFLLTILAVIAVSLFSLPKKTKARIRGLLSRSAWIVTGWVIAFGILLLATFINPLLGPTIQLLFQVLIVLPLFSVFRVFAVHLANDKL